MRARFTTLALLAIVGAAMPGGVAHAACGPAGGTTIADAAPSEGDVVFHGGGLGHGIGMSQYGANGAAALGCSHEEILETYYPTATLSSGTGADEIVVGLVDPSHQTARGAAAVIEVRATSSSSLGAADISWEITGCATASACQSQPPVQKPGVIWQVVPDASGRVAIHLVTNGKRADTPLWVGGQAGATLIAHHDRTVVNVRPVIGGTTVNARFSRWGQLEIITTGTALPASGSSRSSTSFVRQRITAGRDLSGTARYQGLDRYLWGLGEVPSSFEPAAQRAQAVAARTYALRRIGGGLRSSCGCHVVTTPADQNWTGWSKESEDLSFTDGTWRDQVLATQRQVMTHNDRLIDALYSSSHGGHTESPAYVWGTSDPGYLSPIDDSRWDVATDSTRWKNPHRTWAASFTWSTLASKLNAYADRPNGGTFTKVTNVSVASPVGSPARADGVRITGVKSGRTVVESWDGWDVRQALGLKSPNFVVEVVQDLSKRGVAITGDWDGDGTTDLGWFDRGAIALRTSDGIVTRYRYGKDGDVPIVGDFDGDGDDTVSIIRDRVWHINHELSGGAAASSFIYGRLTAGDLPLAGDWDGDGRDGIGIVRRGEWHLRNAVSGGAAQQQFVYGRVLAGDVPVVGDWRGVGADRVGIVRGTTWHLRYELAGGAADKTLRYGDESNGDVPVVGDWDGRNGDDTTGIVRGSMWLLRDDLRGGAATRTKDFDG